MRLFLLSFLLAWVSGCVLGVNDINLKWLIFSFVIAAAVAWLWRLSYPQIAALLLLLLLGFVYGLPDQNRQLATCMLDDTEIGTVTARPTTKTDQTQLLVSFGPCQVILSVPLFVNVKAGDTISTTGGSVQSLADIKAYSPGYADYLARRGISFTWRYPTITLITSPQEHQLFPLSLLSTAILNRVQAIFVEPDASLVAAMLLAIKGTIPTDISRQFRLVGVSHILAISGLHISIIAGLIYSLISLLPLPPGRKTVLVLALSWAYVIFIGLPWSAVRAASFLSTALVFFRLGRLTSLPTALILTVATLVTIKPDVILAVSFQLSTSAVVGIFLTLFLASKQALFKTKQPGITTRVYQLFLVSLGATLGTWPLLAYHFGAISTVGLLTNLLVVPIVPLIITFALIALALAFVWLPAALLFSLPAHWLLQWLLFITSRVASLPGVYFNHINLSWRVVLLYYFLSAAAVVAITHWQKRNWREIWV